MNNITCIIFFRRIWNVLDLFVWFSEETIELCLFWRFQKRLQNVDYISIHSQINRCRQNNRSRVENWNALLQFTIKLLNINFFRKSEELTWSLNQNKKLDKAIRQKQDHNETNSVRKKLLKVKNSKRPLYHLYTKLISTVVFKKNLLMKVFFSLSKFRTQELAANQNNQTGYKLINWKIWITLYQKKLRVDVCTTRTTTATFRWMFAFSLNG